MCILAQLALAAFGALFTFVNALPADFAAGEAARATDLDARANAFPRNNVNVSPRDDNNSTLLARDVWPYADAGCSTSNFYCLVADSRGSPSLDHFFGGIVKITHTDSTTTWWFSKPCKGELVMTCPDQHYKHNIRGVTTFNMGGASGGASVFSTGDNNIHGIISDYQVLSNAPGLSPITAKAKFADMYVACLF